MGFNSEFKGLIRPMEAELFNADGQTDMMNPIICFDNFAKAPKNLYVFRTLLKIKCFNLSIHR